MKKKLLATLILSAALMLAACGSDSGAQQGTENSANGEVSSEESGDATKESEETPVPVYLKDMDMDKYVTLGDYKEITVEVKKAELAEEDIKWEFAKFVANVVTKESGAILDRPVAIGDLINIDFAGYKDGVAFDGGTAVDYQLAIGSGQFIDGFETGLVGVKPGETVDLNLKFPENYGNEELNGAPVVFTVTVNYIIPGTEEATDDIVQALAIEGVTNSEQLYKYVEEEGLKAIENQYQSNIENAILTKFIEGCTVKEIPADRLAADKAQTRGNLESQAASYGMDAELYVKYFYGMELEAFVDAYTEPVTKQLMAMQAVANKEGLGITDEELNSMLEEYATAAGASSVDEFRGNINIETYREYFMYDKVLNFLVENATITN